MYIFKLVFIKINTFFCEGSPEEQKFDLNHYTSSLSIQTPAVFAVAVIKSPILDFEDIISISQCI